MEEVARRCEPPTTAQTIGRLETGTRSLSVTWLERIARAMAVEPQDLLASPEVTQLKVAAVLGPGGAHQPEKEAIVVPPRTFEGEIAVLVAAGIGEYRAGDELWCETLMPQDYGRALNRDVLVPRPGNRLLFGRLINRDDEKLHILPLDSGGRQQVLQSPAWLAVARRLIRVL